MDVSEPVASLPALSCICATLRRVSRALTGALWARTAAYGWLSSRSCSSETVADTAARAVRETPGGLSSIKSCPPSRLPATRLAGRGKW